MAHFASLLSIVSLFFSVSGQSGGTARGGGNAPAGRRVICSWCLVLASVAAWGELRHLNGSSGAFVRIDLIPCDAILP